MRGKKIKQKRIDGHFFLVAIADKKSSQLKAIKIPSQCSLRRADFMTHSTRLLMLIIVYFYLWRGSMFLHWRCPLQTMFVEHFDYFIYRRRPTCNWNHNKSRFISHGARGLPHTSHERFHPIDKPAGRGMMWEQECLLVSDYTRACSSAAAAAAGE